MHARVTLHRFQEVAQRRDGQPVAVGSLFFDGLDVTSTSAHARAGLRVVYR